MDNAPPGEGQSYRLNYKLKKFDGDSLVVRPYNAPFAFDMLFTGSKRNAECDDVSGGKLIDAVRGNKSATQAYIFHTAVVCIFFMRKDDFRSVRLSLINTLEF